MPTASRSSSKAKRATARKTTARKTTARSAAAKAKTVRKPRREGAASNAVPVTAKRARATSGDGASFDKGKASESTATGKVGAKKRDDAQRVSANDGSSSKQRGSAKTRGSAKKRSSINQRNAKKRGAAKGAAKNGDVQARNARGGRGTEAARAAGGKGVAPAKSSKVKGSASANAASKKSNAKVAPARSASRGDAATKTRASKVGNVGAVASAEKRAKPGASKPRRGPQLEGMASKSERSGRPAARGESHPAQQLKFGFKDERSEVAVLQKENRHLLLQIAKRRALITVSKQAVEELMRELSERVIPYREELFSITRELGDLRDMLLDSSGLSTSQLEKVRWALHQMLATLPLEEAEEAEKVDVPTTAQARSGATERGAEATSTGAAGATAEPAHRANVASEAKAGPTPSDSGAAVEYEFAPRSSVSAESTSREAPSAAKPVGDQSGALRTLFKKLAITHHPDRVQDEAVKAARTKIMKELTLAFESGDLARLLELERTLAARANNTEVRETPEVQVQKLTQSNQALRAQLRELEGELNRLKDDCPFTLDMRSRDPARLARDELDQLVLDRHLEVERAAKTRDFVALFAAGRMKLADFLKGPPHLRRFNEAQLAQMMR